MAWTRGRLGPAEAMALKGREADDYRDWCTEHFEELMADDAPSLEDMDDGIEEPAPLVIDYSNQQIEREDIERIASTLEIDPDPRATAARERARRSNMIRKLKNRYNTYVPFTCEDAAQRCKMREGEMNTFLQFECSIAGSLFSRLGDGRYMIRSPWGP